MNMCEFFFGIFFLNLCLTLLGLRCHTWALSSCSAWAAYCSSFSVGAWSLGAQPQQCGAGLVAPRNVGSSEPGIEPVCSALAGQFLTGPPGKPCVNVFGSLEFDT